MNKFLIILASMTLMTAAHAKSDCPAEQFLNAYDLSAEDVSIILSVRSTDSNCTAMSDPMLSHEAGWDVSVRQGQCSSSPSIATKSKINAG
jgi:hypothetical protein